MYLYAFDVSLAQTGLSIFDLKTFKPVHVTSFKTNKKVSSGERLRGIEQEILKLIKIYEPSEVVIERGFTRFNTSTQQIFRTHGVIQCRMWNYPTTTIVASHWKLIVAGIGNATKERVKKILESKYPDIKFKNTDESDSFGLGIAYLIEKHNMEWDVLTKKPKKERKSTKSKTKGTQ